MIFHEYFRSWGGEKFPIWLIYYWQTTHIFTQPRSPLLIAAPINFIVKYNHLKQQFSGSSLNLNQWAPQEWGRDKCEPLSGPIKQSESTSILSRVSQTGKYQHKLESFQSQLAFNLIQTGHGTILKPIIGSHLCSRVSWRSIGGGRKWCGNDMSMLWRRQLSWPREAEWWSRDWGLAWLYIDTIITAVAQHWNIGHLAMCSGQAADHVTAAPLTMGDDEVLPWSPHHQERCCDRGNDMM